MIAVRNWSSDHFPELKITQWVVGYDWQRGQILYSGQIVSAFARHQGFGAWFDASTSRTPTAQEIKQFELEKLTSDKALP